MPRHPGLSQWHQTVSTHLPDLSQPQVTVLVLWSIGIVLAQSCGLTTVAVMLAYLLDLSECTMRERLRDFYRDAVHKRGAKCGVKRRSLDVSACFPALLRWIIATMPLTCRQLALAMDASTLGQRFTILTISVVVRGCAIPVAWHIVEATRAGSWRPHWEALFAISRAWCLPIGRCSWRPTAGCTPNGSFRSSSSWGGIPTCASIARASTDRALRSHSARSARW